MTAPLLPSRRATAAAVPSLDALAADPGLALGLSPAARQVLMLKATAVIAACAASLDKQPPQAASGPERMLGVGEAAKMLGMTRDFLYRRWPKLGLGYKDSDGRLKFPLEHVQRYIRERAGQETPRLPSTRLHGYTSTRQSSPLNQE